MGLWGRGKGLRGEVKPEKRGGRRRGAGREDVGGTGVSVVGAPGGRELGAAGWREAARRSPGAGFV